VDLIKAEVEKQSVTTDLFSKDYGLVFIISVWVDASESAKIRGISRPSTTRKII